MEYGASLTEAEFKECLKEALYGELVFSDWTPWGDLTGALEAIAASPRPVPQTLIESAWAVYRSHIRRPDPSG